MNNMSEENTKLPKAPNKLVITGKGRFVEGWDSETNRYAGAITSDLKVLLGGNDVTDKIKTVKDWPAFISNKMCDELYQPEFTLTEDGESLPPSVFTLPEDFDFDKIELIKVDRDFEDLYEGGIWADYILYDGKELEADTLYDEFYGEEDYYGRNFEWYSENVDGEETRIYRF